MSNLIPTPRTDRNGRTVTRHMKPDTATNTQRNTPLPPVTLKTPDEHAVLTDKTVQRLSEKYEEYFPSGFNAEAYKRTHEALASYGITTLRRINKHDWSFDSTAQFNTGITFNNWDETTVNDYLAADTVLKELEPTGVPAMHISSWGLYPELHPADNTSDYPQERLNQIVALYMITEEMFAQDQEPYSRDETTNQINAVYIEPSPIRDLIFNPGPNRTSEDVARIITAHHTLDLERIKVMLDIDSPSMSSGAL